MKVDTIGPSNSAPSVNILTNEMSNEPKEEALKQIYDSNDLSKYLPRKLLGLSE